MNWNRYAIAAYPGDLWRDWDLLNARYCHSHPMLDGRFVQALTAYFPAEIDILRGSEDGKLVALALLDRVKGIVQLPYLPSQAQLALILVPANISLFEPFSNFGLRHGTCRFDLLAIDSHYQEALPQVNGAEAEVRGIDMVVDVSGSFAEYWAQRPKNLRKNISRYINRITNELGDYELRVVTKAQDMALAVARYGFMESRGWKGKSGTSLHPGNSQGNFYCEILQNYSQTGEAIVFELWINNEIVASRLCISNGDLLIILKTTFDEDYKKYAFGRILLYEVLKYLFSSGMAKTVDFYTNASKEQLDWSTGSRPIYNISFYYGLAGSLLRQFIRSKKALLARSKKHIN